MRTVREGWSLAIPSPSLSLVLLTSGTGGTFVRIETRDIEGGRKIGKKMLLKWT